MNMLHSIIAIQTTSSLPMLCAARTEIHRQAVTCVTSQQGQTHRGMPWPALRSYTMPYDFSISQGLHEAEHLQ